MATRGRPRIHKVPFTWCVAFAKVIAAKMEHWDAISIRQTLDFAGLWSRLERAGYVIASAAAKAAELTPAQKRAELLNQLYLRGMNGDVTATKHYMELSKEVEVKSAFDVHVSIMDYTIADKSLYDIVMDADEKPVGDIMKGIVNRCRVDAFSEALTAKMEKLFDEWVVEATAKFKDAADVPRLIEASDEPDPFIDEATVDANLEKMMSEV